MKATRQKTTTIRVLSVGVALVAAELYVNVPAPCPQAPPCTARRNFLHFFCTALHCTALHCTALHCIAITR